MNMKEIYLAMLLFKKIIHNKLNNKIIKEFK